MRELAKKIAFAISDPCHAGEGYKGERTLTEWQTDAVMRAMTSHENFDAVIDAFADRVRRDGGYLPAISTLLRIKADELADRFPDDTNAGRS